MGLLTYFDTLIREHGSASIRADQIALLRDEISVFERKLVDATALSFQYAETIAQLKSQNEQLHAKLRDLQAIIDQQEQFDERNGAMFKRDGQGGHHDAVYCPRCHVSTSPSGPASMGSRRFTCTCGWQSPFQVRDIHSIRATLKSGEQCGEPEESRG